ncbi:amino acid ABC transporter permease [Kaistia sp. 32K]|uniref:amino acid ABC transporter permease n=1 Tax=Kaistia sp. 32K TaxID=2795690 RepID=UPI001914E938|nr:amino acid ABC transporter permease [Kaistia sp. 32K]BCP55204.1 amino acid ABC transporter permease [Kaistia sp. 32K]
MTHAKTGASRALALSVVVFLAILVSGCTNTNYNWSWYILSPFDARGQQNLRFLLAGFGTTVGLSVAASLISMAIGIVVALMSFARWRPVCLAARSYVEIFRAIPILVFILWVFYGLPILTGVRFDVFTTGLICLAVSDSAFTSEIFRSGLQSLDRGQPEAARSLGLGPVRTLRLVVLPQVVRAILPALGNQFVYVLKMSSLVSVIGLQELTRRANELTLVEYRPLEIYTFLVAEYLVLILIISWLVRRLEVKLRLRTSRR